jgi:D-serine deaminase-like pyridoxal phosphate-dependent protein
VGDHGGDGQPGAGRARALGVGRILIANEVVEPAALRWIARELDGDPSFECLCLVDSPAGVELMAAALGRRSARPLAVLLELGSTGGRAGCRTEDEALAVAGAVARADTLRLLGVEAFEGLLESAAAVDELLDRLGRTARAIEAARLFADLSEIVVTAGGSRYFDRVVERLASLDLGLPVRLVLRSGCYLTHDHGLYDRSSPFGSRGEGDRLRPALEAWGVVLSRPEPALAIVGFGKRDVPYDAGLPVPLRIARGGRVRDADGELEVVAVNDQHAYVRLAPGAELAVGDLLGCGVSHPCTAFDKWPLIPVVDEGYQVVGAVRTFF